MPDFSEYVADPSLKKPVDCFDCGGTGKVEYYVRVGQEARKEDALRRLLDVVYVDGVLNGKTDAEIADLLQQDVYNTTSALSPYSVLVSNTIDRLLRAGGGALKEE